MTIFRLSLRPIALAAAVAAGTVAADTDPAAACSDTPYMGTVCITAASYCPRGYADMIGQYINIQGNEALYSLMGTMYGGDGRVNFAVPDMRGRSAIGIGQAPGYSAVYQGQRRGAEHFSIDVANMPPHNHPAYGYAADGTIPATNGAWIADPVGMSGKTPVNSTAFVPNGFQGTLAQLNPDMVGNTGGGQPLYFYPPQIGLRFCIALNGIYPPRN